MKMFQEMAAQCGRKEGASDDDVNGILAFKPTNTRGSKCVEACLGEASGVVSVHYQNEMKSIVFASAILNLPFCCPCNSVEIIDKGQTSGS